MPGVAKHNYGAPEKSDSLFGERRSSERYEACDEEECYSMKKFLIVVDMQKDFVDGSLGTKEAQAIIDNSVREISEFDGEIIATLDTHFDNYLDTAEGRKLPVIHCVKDTAGWQIDGRIREALDKKGYTQIIKYTFGSTLLPEIIRNKTNGEEFSAELIGLCTDICVVSNALLLKANFPEMSISVKADCCAGVTPDLHRSALETMKSCQIDII